MTMAQKMDEQIEGSLHQQAEVEKTFQNFVDFMEHTTKQIKMYGRLDPAVVEILKQQQHLIKLSLEIAENTITPRDIYAGGR